MSDVISTLPALDDLYEVDADALRSFKRDGHTVLRGVCSAPEIDAYGPVIKEAAFRFNRETRPLSERETYGKAFLQIPNIWRKDEAVAKFVLAPRFAKIAADLLEVEAVRIYHDQAPEKTQFPFVIFSYQSGEDVNGVGTCRILSRDTYQVKVVSRENDSNTRLAADRIDEVIGKAKAAQHPQDLSFKFSGRRTQPVSYTEPDEDSSRFFRHLGGLYRIDVSAA